MENQVKKQKVIISVNEKFLETFGSGTLIGGIVKKIDDTLILKDAVEEVELVFEESSLGWRQKNGGPNLWITPEYVIGCLILDIIQLHRWGIKVSILKQIKDPG